MQHSTNPSWMGELTDFVFSEEEITVSPLLLTQMEFFKKHLKDSDIEKQDFLVRWRQDLTFWPSFNHSSRDALWWHHDAVGEFFSSWDEETGLG